MDDLKELTEIVNRKKLMKLTILGSNEDSMLDQLYHMIESQEAKTHEEAAELLYGEDEIFPAYQKLKSKLKGRLIDMLILINEDPSISNNGAIPYREMHKEWMRASLLFSHNIIQAGVATAEGVLDLAIKFEYIDIALLASKKLREVAAVYLGDEAKYQHYNTLYQEYEKIAQVEAEVEHAYAKLMIKATGQVPDNQEMAQVGEQLFRQVEPYLEQYDFIVLHWFIRYIQVTYLLNARAHEDTIHVCQLMLDFVGTKPHINTANVQMTFLSHQLVCYTQLRAFEEGRATLKRCQELLTGRRASRNYFKVQELGMTLFLHSKHYQEAYELVRAMMSKDKMNQQNKFHFETWKIYEAYIYYLIYTGYVKPSKNDGLFSTFRLGKFLNEVPIYAKDKRGMNVPILILQILFSIAMGKFDQIFDRMEAIQKYTTRYIRKDDSFRSNCFIKMLLQIPIAGFQQKASGKLGKRYLNMLMNAPLEVADQPHEIEIIPYEDLWQMALDSLKLAPRM